MVAMPPAKRLTGLNPLAYLGVEPLSPLEFVINPRDPGQSDNQFNIGTIWLNNLSEDPWMLVNLDQRVATWLRFGAGGSGDLDTLTGNTGGAVGPDVSQNINVLGDNAAGLTITGNPGTFTLTVTSVNGGRLGESLTGDVGAAAVFDANGNIDVIGGANINTATPGTGSQVIINLNDVIRWPSTNAAGTEGIIYLGGTSGAGGFPFMHNAGTDSTFLGLQAASILANTGSNNTAVGFEALEDISSGTNNTAIGAHSLDEIDVGSGNTGVGANSLLSANGPTALFNTALGSGSLSALTTGSENTACGQSSLQQLVTGQNNLALGISAGGQYTGAESNNICIENAGTAGDNDTIRIGSPVHTRNFQEGIVGVSPANQASVVIDTTTGQLGVGGGGGNAGDNAFLAVMGGASGVISTLGTPVYLMGTNGLAVGPITMTEIFDVDNVFFPGDGTNPATFTAPADGIYQFEWNADVGGTAVSSIGVVQFSLGFIINGSTANAWVTESPQFTGASQTSQITRYNVIILSLSSADVITFGIEFAATSQGSFRTPSGAALGITNVCNWICGFRVA